MSDTPSPKFSPGLRSFGPYVLIEVLLPGGTLLAVLLWLLQRFKRGRFGSMRRYFFRQVAALPVAAAKPFPHSVGICQFQHPTAVFIPSLSEVCAGCGCQAVAAR